MVITVTLGDYANWLLYRGDLLIEVGGVLVDGFWLLAGCMACQITQNQELICYNDLFVFVLPVTAAIIFFLQSPLRLEQWVKEIDTGIDPQDEELGDLHLYCVVHGN